ncbi:MAG: septum site-determining protein MinD [Clostridia bacterium]|nr:septum site-determining protein MinD [Clostridia bacterium]
MGKAWLIASGKGGVGKSTLCAALGCALAKDGHSVAIMDAVIGLRNQDTLLGLENRIVYDLVDVAEKNCDLAQALVAHSVYPNLCLLPASQFHMMNSVNTKDMRKLAGALKARFDYVLIDAPTGVDRGFLNALEPADEVILVVTPDDIAIRDAERAASVIEKNKAPRPSLIVNRIIGEWVKRGEMYSPQTVAMTLDLPLLGVVPQDEEVYRSLLQHTDWLTGGGEAQAAVSRIAARLQGKEIPIPKYAVHTGLLNRFKRKKGEIRL